MLDTDALAPLLTTARLGRAVRAFDAVGSTMTEAAAWAAAGAPDGAVVVAEHQTAGRGRLGRQWADEPGANLLLSTILRPTLPVERLGLVALAAGVAIADAIEQVADLQPQLKWPNDVLIDGRKAAGVLVESQLTPGRPPVLIVGTGLNVNATRLPPDVAARATSIRLACGRPIDRVPLLAALLGALEVYVEGLAADGGATLRLAWEARMAGREAPITVQCPGTPRPPVAGRALGLAEDGALRIATPEREVTVYAGEATIGKESPAAS